MGMHEFSLKGGKNNTFKTKPMLKRSGYIGKEAAYIIEIYGHFYRGTLDKINDTLKKVELIDILVKILNT